MPIVSLYRKYRPNKFAEVLGQEATVAILKEAMKIGHIHHAYLFSGPRGSGKTTVARIIAKALNCEKSKEGEPCDQCQSCLAIKNDNHLDVIEIDAASNRGIEEIKKLREQVRVGMAKSPFKVFIIDEVHMLTKEAFNALLKTLEEPPRGVVFIMATTEPNKVPETILSRVLRFDFKKGGQEQLKSLLEGIVDKENLKIESGALELIAQLSTGSFRDGLTLLDQIAPFAQDKAISIEEILDILGLPPLSLVFNLAQHILNQERKEALNLISEIEKRGLDLNHLLLQLTHIFRALFLFKMSKDVKFLLFKGPSEQKNLVNQLEGIDEAFLKRAVEQLIWASDQLKRTMVLSLPLELVIVRLTEGQKKESPKVTKVNSNLVELWTQFLEETKKSNHSLFGILKESVPLSLNEDKLILQVRFKFHKERIESSTSRKILSVALQKVFGKDIPIECQINPEAKLKEDEILEELSQVFEISK